MHACNFIVMILFNTGLILVFQQRRSYSGVFAGKYGLITLRDLFRWAERYRKSVSTEKTFYDWEQQLAEDGMCECMSREQQCTCYKIGGAVMSH